MKRNYLLLLLAFTLSLPLAALRAADQPNVVLIMTDDQGHGDLGFHGNPVLKTPNLDRLAQESVRFEHFYVSPVCAPTRASLMTGRYNYRTGVTDTWLGRAMMYSDEVTLAEMLEEAGYRTGIFGKWHLGDNYPLRAMDQGFEESLVHMGGGIGQPSDPPANSYFDPILQKNGKATKTKGYCSDVFTEAAIEFIRKNRRKPFFVYLPYNAPHTPLQVPDSYYQYYKLQDLSPGRFPDQGHPLPKKIDEDATARVYGMVQNIDDNVGRLLDQLDELGLRENTIVIFLSDNGPQQARYNSGLRDRKGSVHEGGIRVPFFIRWPARLQGGRKLGIMAAHIDIAPTLLDFCNVPVPNNVFFDGLSLRPLLMAQPGEKLSWSNRTLFFQWHRGDEPEVHRAFAARTQRFKLVQPIGRGNQPRPANPEFQLYDMINDPIETQDVSEQYPDIVQEMKRDYEKWLAEVSATRGFEPPLIYLGASEDNPTTLTRQDWRGPAASWRPDGLGHWEVFVERSGNYHITLRFAAVTPLAKATFSVGGVSASVELEPDATECTFKGVRLPEGPTQLNAWIELPGDQRIGVHYVDVKRTWF